MDLTRAVVDAKDSCQELTDSCKEMSDSCQELADSYKSLQAIAADLLSSWERFKVQQAAATSSRTTTTTPPPTSTTPPPTTTTTPPPTSTTPPPTPLPQATPTPEEAPASYSIPTMSAVAPHTATAVILQLPTRCSTLGVAHDAGGIDDKVALVEPATVEAWPTIALQFWVQHVPAPARPLVHPRQGPPKNPVPAGDCDSRCFDDNGRLFLTSSFRPSIDAIERGDFSPWKNARYIGRCLPDNLSSLSPGRYKTMRLIELQHLGVTDMGSLWDSIAKNWLVTVIIVARQACDGLKNSTADAIHSLTVFFLPHKILELVSSRPPGPPTNCSKRNAFSRVNNGWQSMHLVMNIFLLWRHIDFILKEVGVFAIQVQSMAAILMRPWDPGVVDLFSMNILLVHWNILRADSKPEIQVTSWCSITCSEWPSPNSCFQYYFQNVHVQRYGHVTSMVRSVAYVRFAIGIPPTGQYEQLQLWHPPGQSIISGLLVELAGLQDSLISLVDLVESKILQFCCQLLNFSGPIIITIHDLCSSKLSCLDNLHLGDKEQLSDISYVHSTYAILDASLRPVCWVTEIFMPAIAVGVFQWMIPCPLPSVSTMRERYSSWLSVVGVWFWRLSFVQLPFQCYFCCGKLQPLVPLLKCCNRSPVKFCYTRTLCVSSLNILVEYTSTFSRMLAEYEKLLEVTVEWKFPLLCLATQDKSPISGSVYQIIVMQAWFDHIITANHLLFAQGSELVFFHGAANGQVALDDSDSRLHAAIDFVHSSTLVLLWNQEHVCHDLQFQAAEFTKLSLSTYGSAKCTHKPDQSTIPQTNGAQAELQASCLKAAAWGQAAFEGERNVTDQCAYYSLVSWENVMLRPSYLIWKITSYGQSCLPQFPRLKILHDGDGLWKLILDEVQTTWDPGGFLLVHRLEGKPCLKNGGMSWTVLASGPWAFTRCSRYLRATTKDKARRQSRASKIM